MKRFLAGGLLLIVLLAGAYFLWQANDRNRVNNGAESSFIPLLAEANTEGYALALQPGTIEFPRDLGAHEAYQTEWWYYTGNLESEDGRRFGFQLTFFRRSLTPAAEPAADPAGSACRPMEAATNAPGNDDRAIATALPVCTPASNWRTNQVYLAHFAISDIANSDFYSAERFSRGAAGLAGAQASPYRVWLENWFAQEVGADQVRLSAATEQVALELTLTEHLPPILHGDRGLSLKGDEPGNASYYYSIVQQQTAGTVTIMGQEFAVTGLTWMDHEYSTSVLSQEAVGWDWFSLQFDNGAALMFFQIRRADGTLEPASSGSFVAPDGARRHLDRAAWQLEIVDTWTSPVSGATYPAAWRIRVPALELELEGRPLMPNQELNLSTTYWEGAVVFDGHLASRPVSARGYIEMTGYAGSTSGRLSD